MSFEKTDYNINDWCITLSDAADGYEPLRPYLDERDRIDFGDPNALRTYNQAIAKLMFDLDIEVPPDNLIPTICLRYAYAKIVSERISPSTMLEIGTGSSAIIAMIAAKEFGIKIVATEKDELSFEYARRNIESNNLEDSITVIKSDGGILDGVVDDQNFDVLMTYPPIYPVEDKLKYTIDRSSRGFQGSESEMIGGGAQGYDFIDKLITEIKSNFHQAIKIITFLLIKKHQAEHVGTVIESICSKIEMLSIKAGTRTRYIVIAHISSISTQKLQS